MKRKYILLLGIAIFFSLSLNLTLRAQDYYKKQKPAPAQEVREEAVSEEKIQRPGKRPAGYS